MLAKLRAWLGHDVHPAIQFIKYGFAGGCAAVTFFGTIELVTRFLLPTEGMTPEVRRTNMFIALSVAFLTSNAVGYLLNIRFVFKPGRHPPRRELALFLGLAGIAWALTAPASSWAMGAYPNLSKWVPGVATAVASALINYTGRKFFIFKS